MRVWGLGLAALALMAVPALAQEAPTPGQQNPGWWLPDAASDYSWQVDRLYIWIFWVVILMFLLTEGLLIYFCIVYRRRPGHRPTYTHGSHKAEITWTVVPALMLLAIALIQIPAWNHIKKPDWAALRADPKTVNVDILGQQFKWNVRYPGTKAKFKTESEYTNLSIVHTPIGATTVMSLRSADVIHSVFIPHMRVKQDTVPGLRQSIWFRPNRFKVIQLKDVKDREYKEVEVKTFDGTKKKVQPSWWVNSEAEFAPGGHYYDKRVAVSPIHDYTVVDGFYDVYRPQGRPKKVRVLHQGRVLANEEDAEGTEEWDSCDYALGIFEIACAELCGYEHHTMRAFLIVEPKASYDKWLETQAKQDNPPPPIWKAWRQ